MSSDPENLAKKSDRELIGLSVRETNSTTGRMAAEELAHRRYTQQRRHDVVAVLIAGAAAMIALGSFLASALGGACP